MRRFLLARRRREAPHFSNFGPPARSEDVDDLFVERRPFCETPPALSDFSRFGPRPEPTLVTLLAPQSEDLFAEAPVGAGWGPRRTLAAHFL